MPTVLVFSAAILLTTAFCVQGKKLHLFEILAVWFTVIIVNDPSYSYFLVNRHWISTPENREFALVRIVYSNVIVPLFTVWYIDWLFSRRKMITRILLFAAAIPLSSAGAWLLNRWGIVYYHGPAWWAYAADRTVILLLSVGSVCLLRHLMRKDGLRL